jgi:ABC-2 type transport system permease protein
MSKMWLITRREYLTRVRNKTFLISTFLLPVVFILFIFGAALIQAKTKSHPQIAVIDANGFFKDYLKGDSALTFDFSPGIDTMNYEQHGCSAVLIIPKLPDSGTAALRLKYKKSLGLEQTTALKDHLRDAVTDHMIFEKTTVSRAKLDSIRDEAPVTEVKSFEDLGTTTKASDTTAATAGRNGREDQPDCRGNGQLGPTLRTDVGEDHGDRCGRTDPVPAVGGVTGCNRIHCPGGNRT